MKTQTPEKRIQYLDVLRILACLAVIVMHIAKGRIGNYAIGTDKWLFLNTFDSISRFAVPVFVMISGALFLDPKKEWDARKMYTKNLVRIVTAFLFWSAVYAFVDHLNGVRLRTVAYNFITGNTHLWFLYVIIGLYLVVPILRKITESENLTKYFLALWIVVSVLIPTVVYGLSYYSDRYANWMQAIANKIGIELALGYSGYFVLGYYLHAREIKKPHRILLYCAGIFGAAGIAVLTYLFAVKRGYLDYSYGNYFTFGVFLPASAAFVFCKYHTPAFRKDTAKTILYTAAKCSFGVYLVHLLFVQHLDKLLHFNELIPSTAFYVPVMTVIVFLLSLAVSFILNQIPFVKKLIV